MTICPLRVKSVSLSLSANEQKVYDVLSREEVTMDEVIRRKAGKAAGK